MFRLSAVHMYFSSTIRIQKCTDLKISFFAMFRWSADLQFKCIFHEQSGSEIKVKAGSGIFFFFSFGSTALLPRLPAVLMQGIVRFSDSIYPLKTFLSIHWRKCWRDLYFAPQIRSPTQPLPPHPPFRSFIISFSNFHLSFRRVPYTHLWRGGGGG